MPSIALCTGAAPARSLRQDHRELPNTAVAKAGIIWAPRTPSSSTAWTSVEAASGTLGQGDGNALRVTSALGEGRVGVASLCHQRVLQL